MKKLLVLMLVLGMNPAASALNLTIRMDPTTPIVTVGGELDQDLYIALLSKDGSLTDYTLGSAAPSMSMYFVTEAPMFDEGLGFLVPTGYTGEVWVMASQPGEPYSAGDYLTATVNPIIGAYACWFDEDGGYGIIGEVVLLPEPMTLALLGLGGLFVLRRRK